MTSNLTGLIDKIGLVEAECLQAIARAATAAELTEADNKYLSKKGALTELLKTLRDIAPEDRPKVGARVNEAKAKLEGAMSERRAGFENQALAAKLEAEKIDFTLPARRIPVGSIHPISKVIAEVTSIFARLGFEFAEGPEIETEFNNFDSMNLPADHPARDMQDTFYVKAFTEKLPPNATNGVAHAPAVANAATPGAILLRTHTSPVQTRTMLAKKQPPIRMICAGAVFRSDYDATHSPMFHQMEALYIDKDVSFAELRGTLLFFAREMFGAQTQIRLRPSYFPFVEPGAEVDVSCVMCKGKGCRVCKETGWLEILGAGMVHPNVLRAGGLDPSGCTGFALGMGIERIAMLKFGLPDLRLLFENDVRFLRQFGV